MSNTTNTFPGDGITTQQEINFLDGYLNRDHVKAYIENTVTEARTPVTITAEMWLNASTITGLPVTPIGSNLVIYRATPRAALTNFTQGSQWTEANLDLAARQGLFVATEVEDGGAGGSNPGVDYILPPATGATLGGVKVGSNLSVDPDGTLHASAGGGGSYTLPPATDTVLGGVKVSTGLAVAGDGTVTLKAPAGGNIGGVKAGTNITIDANGTIHSGAGGGGAAATRIVVVGDSHTARNPLLSRSWAEHLEDLLIAAGADVEVFNLAINGWTLNKANTTAAFGADTMLQKAIALSPEIVLVALGFNDAVFNVEGRSLAQCQADAAAFFATLRTNLPDALIVYARELAYDNVHGTPATLTNQQVIPFLMQKKTSGILTDLYCAEMLPDAAASSTRTNYTNWDSLDAHIQGLAQVDAVFALPIWKATRLGLCGLDTVHLSAEGNIFLGAAARKAFKTVPAMAAAVPGLSNQNYASFDDPDALFSALLVDTGTAYATASWSDVNYHPVMHYGPWKACAPDVWYLPSKGVWRSTSLTYTVGNQFAWHITGTKANTQVESSFAVGAGAPSAWANAPGLTDARGDFHDVGVVPVAAGSYVFRYKVGNEVWGPVTLTASGAASAKFGARIYLASSSGYTTPAGSYYNIPMGSGVDGTAGITVPRAGWYNIAGQATGTLPTDSSALASIFVNGVRRADGCMWINGKAATFPYAVNVAAQLLLAANDVVTLRIFTEDSGPINFGGGGAGAGTYLGVTEQ